MENPFFRQASLSPPIKEPIKHLHRLVGTKVWDPPDSIQNLVGDVGVKKLLKAPVGLWKSPQAVSLKT